MEPVWPSFDDLLRAFLDCRHRKAPSYHQLHFESRLGAHLAKLEDEILDGAYQPLPSLCFVVQRPKPREIYAAHFRDRVVHHLVVSRLEPLYEPSLCSVSFACRKGKGTHGAIRQLQRHGRALSLGGEKPLWALKLDIARFFVTIDRALLTQIVRSKVRDPTLRRLTDVLFNHDGRVGCRRRGRSEDFAIIPPEKSWFWQPADRGLPIGNLTSQFGANLYLNALDHFILRSLKPKAYVRYMDDLVFVDSDPVALQGLEEAIDEWLRKFRGQRLNQAKTQLTPLRRGIEYLGYWIRQTESPSHPIQLFLPPKKKWELVQHFRKLERLGLPRRILPHPLARACLDPQRENPIPSVNSALGYAAHARSWKLRRKLFDKMLLHPKLLGRLSSGSAPLASVKIEL